MTQSWSPADYQQHAAFVPALGAPMLGVLAPQAGERILDLGCGDGVLTAQIVESGAKVVGVDASPEMVAAARARGIDAHVVDASALTFVSEFDAVFSNAVLHWVPDADAVLRGVSRALRPGGRFVAEFGGHLNVAAISAGMRAVFKARGLPLAWPWYYPTTDEYAQKVVAAGLGRAQHRARAAPDAAAHRASMAGCGRLAVRSCLACRKPTATPSGARSSSCCALSCATSPGTGRRTTFASG